MLWESLIITRHWCPYLSLKALRCPTRISVLPDTCCFSVIAELWRRWFSLLPQSMDLVCINSHPKASSQTHSAAIAWTELFDYFDERGIKRERGRKKRGEKNGRKGRFVFFFKEEITNTVINNLKSRFSERRQYVECCAKSSMWQTIWHLMAYNALTWSGLSWAVLYLAQHALGLTMSDGLARQMLLRLPGGTVSILLILHLFSLDSPHGD